MKKNNRVIENAFLTLAFILSLFIIFTETGFSIALNVVSYCLSLFGMI